jgi:hypothetical protein
LSAYSFTLRGIGSVELPAYGVADAEARVEKEIRNALPGAEVEIRGITRVDVDQRIVETFDVGYHLRVRIEAAGDDEETARREALRSARQALTGTRFGHIAWDTPRRL